MATTTVSQPVGFPQPKEIVRQGAIVALVLLIGVGVGMLIDTGRQTVAAETPQLTQSQAAVADRLTAQAAVGVQAGSDRAIAQVAAAQRAEATAAQVASSVFEINTWAPLGAPAGFSVPEHGEFTPMVTRG
ncbi:MAG: hypothetical protein HKN74_04350, partial [Acidimicrobiia bacterium]|nr:hypothetical protein [Acidimicrobiia bacterium]